MTRTLAPAQRSCVLIGGPELAEPEVLFETGRGGTPTALVTPGCHVDGPEWTADGRWIVYNTEEFTDDPGHSQLARVAEQGGVPERLVESATVDWFPHPSPDGRWGSYLS